MFKKTMKFDNLEGEEVQQTFYFNYNKKEIAELLEFGRILRFPGRAGVTYLPLEEQMAKLSTPMEESGLSNRQNNEQAYEIFQNLLLDAYGVKGDDNVSFDKAPELRHYWSTHVAFPELIFEFLENPAEAAEFIEKCLPPRMVSKAKEEMQRENQGKLTSTGLKDMVEEAARRQQDPATRIEPGPEAAAEALGANAEVAQLAEHVKKEDITATHVGQEPPEPVAPPVELVKGKAFYDALTNEEILAMPEPDFKKLDPRMLNQSQLQAAFRRRA
jgi:hypothetical protein